MSIFAGIGAGIRAGRLAGKAVVLYQQKTGLTPSASRRKSIQELAYSAPNEHALLFELLVWELMSLVGLPITEFVDTFDETGKRIGFQEEKVYLGLSPAEYKGGKMLIALAEEALSVARIEGGFRERLEKYAVGVVPKK